MLMSYVLAILVFFLSKEDEVTDDYRIRMYRIWVVLGYKAPVALLGNI